MSEARADLFAELFADRVLAHQFLFPKRHRDKTPDFHPDLIADFHDDEKHRCDMVFRGGGKSTIAEEAILVRAGFREFRYGLIVGNTIDRACQRLHAIRYELETNDLLKKLYGDLVGPIWAADQLHLANGVMIQAMGRGQSLRGAKHLDQRPDFLFCDDLEEYDDVRTEKARDETWRWFGSDLIPALDPAYIARVAATPLDPDALPMRLERAGGWKIRRIPIMHPGPDGEMVSSWPERFPLTRADAIAIGRDPVKQAANLDSIEQRMDSAQRTGTMRQFRAEYLCEAEAPEDKPFRKDMFRWEPRVHSWEPVFCMFDPARTTNVMSALTGFAAWSWIGPRLVVWDAWARPLMPDQIIEALFEVHERLNPVLIGVEEDGLNEFLMQPIRTEQVKRGISLPIRAMRAPRGKLDFIRALQVWFTAREVFFAQSLPDLENALLAFPSGKIDAPNALAYAPVMRGGAAIYGDFGSRHVAADIAPSRQRPAYLALNATRTMTTAVLVQHIDGCLRIFDDWVREGEPSEVLPYILAEARLAADQRLVLVAPPHHFDRYAQVGLVQAASKAPAEVLHAVDPSRGRPMIRNLLQREIRQMPALMIAERARWTLNAFAGGYRHMVTKQGVLAEVAEEGRYRLIMEGLEAFVGLTEVRSTEREDEGNFATTPQGQRYLTALPGRN